jgi:hypothetical protein
LLLSSASQREVEKGDGTLAQINPTSGILEQKDSKVGQTALLVPIVGINARCGFAKAELAVR